MDELNYTGDIEEMSEEARYLASNGIVILKCYQAQTCKHLKITTRMDFEVTMALVKWYLRERFNGVIVNVNIGDFVRKGDLLISFVG